MIAYRKSALSLIFCVQMSISGMQLRSDQLPTATIAQVGAIERDVFLKVAGTQIVLAAKCVAQCGWIQELIAASASLGTEENPLEVPSMTSQDFKFIEKCLKRWDANDVSRLKYELLGNLTISELATFAKNVFFLKIAPLFTCAKEEITKKLKSQEYPQPFFQTLATFDSVGLPSQAVEAIRDDILTEEDCKTLRLLCCDELVNGVTQKYMFNGSNDYVFTCGSTEKKPGIVTLWDVSSGQRVNELVLNKPIIKVLCGLTPDCIMATDKSLIIANLLTLIRTGTAPILKLPFLSKIPGSLWDMTLSPDSSSLAIGIGRVLVIYNLKSKNHYILDNNDAVELAEGSHLAFTPRGLMLIEIRTNGVIRLWSLESLSCVGTLNAHKTLITAYHCNRQGICATVDQEGKLCLWDVSAHGKLIKDWDNLGVGLCFDSFGKRLLLAHKKEGGGAIFDVDKGECVKTLEGKGTNLLAGSYHPDDIRVATITSNQEICLWDTKSGTIIAHLFFPSAPRSVTFSGDGNVLAIHLADFTVRLSHYCDENIERFLKNGLSLQKALLSRLFVNTYAESLTDMQKLRQLSSIVSALDIGHQCIGRFLFQILQKARNNLE